MHFGVYAPSSPFGRSRNHQSENEQIYQTGTGPAITDKQVYVCLCYLKSLVRYIFIFGTVKLFHSMVAVNFCSNRESKEKMLPAGFYSCGDHDYSFGVELDCLTPPQQCDPPLLVDDSLIILPFINRGLN